MLSSLAVLVVLALPTRSAQAQPRFIDETALALSQQEVKVGLISLEYGLIDRVQIKTYTAAWLALAPSLGLKWQFVDEDVIGLSASAEAIYFNTFLLRQFVPDVPKAGLLIAPFDLATTIRLHPQVAWSAAVRANVAAVAGTAETEEVTLAGAVATTTVEARSVLEWRFDPHASFLLRGRYLFLQGLGAGADLSWQLDEFTRLDVSGKAKSDLLNVVNGFQLTVGSLVSWDNFNLRLGVGYGNLRIPIIGLWTESRGLVPDLDFYWRF